MTRPQFERRRHRASLILEAIGAAFPHAWEHADQLRVNRASWPEWCYLPLSELAGAGPPGPILSALAAWRLTQGIYTLEPAALAAFGTDPPELPEWCIYVDWPCQWSGRHAFGAWIHRDPSGWRALLDCAQDLAQPLAGLMPVSFEPADGSTLAGFVRALAAGRIIGKGAPGNPKPVRSHSAWRLFPARGPRFWRVSE